MTWLYLDQNLTNINVKFLESFLTLKYSLKVRKITALYLNTNYKVFNLSMFQETMLTVGWRFSTARDPGLTPWRASCPWGPL